MDLTEITDQTVERAHVFDVHFGETVVPYAILQPLKAVLPVSHDDFVLLYRLTRPVWAEYV